jgi:hypothetical protein
MKRRTFLSTLTIAGLGIAVDPFSVGPARPPFRATPPIEFLTERTDGSMVFPKPGEGATVDLSPPGFVWLPAEGAAGYRIEIRNARDNIVYEHELGAHPEHRPTEVLEKNTCYTWDVLALDENGEGVARRGEQTFTIAEGAPELPWIAPSKLLEQVPDEHPRLIYTEEKLEAIRQTIGTSRQQSWKRLKASADEALDLPTIQPPEYDQIKDATEQDIAYGEYFHYFRDYIDKALQELSMVYLVTKEEKYAERGKQMLLEIASWPVGWDEVVSVQWKEPGDEPGMSLAKVTHRAYDWLYDAFTESERAQVQALCEEVAGQVQRRLSEGNYLTYSGGSHPARIMAYLSGIAIALKSESDKAEEWLDYSLTGLLTFYPHWGGSDGGWAEGVGYGLWYNNHYMPALEGLRLGADYDLWKRPFFRKIRYFFLYCTAVHGEMRPFGDGAEKGGPALEPAFASLMGYHAHLFDDPQVGWWAKQTGNWNGGAAGGGTLALVFEDDLPSEPPTGLPQARAFHDIGWAGLHSSLAAPEEDTFFLFKSSPFGSVSHSHADQNSFAVAKGGTFLAIPSGYYGPSYGSPHHAQWTRSTKANNSVLVGGEGQVIRESKASGRILAFENQEGLTYVAGDAADAYMGKLDRFDRHVLFLRPGLFVLLDDLEAPDAARFQWMLHALEEMKLSKTTGRIVSRRKDAVLEVHVASPAGVQISQTNEFDTPFDTGMPEDFDEEVAPHWHVTAQTTEQQTTTRIGAVMGVYEAGGPFVLERLQHAGWQGARATGDFGDVEGWVQLEAGASGPEGYGEAVSNGEAKLCGRGADGEAFVV